MLQIVKDKPQPIPHTCMLHIVKDMHSTYPSAYPIGMIWPGVWIHWTGLYWTHHNVVFYPINTFL